MLKQHFWQIFVRLNMSEMLPEPFQHTDMASECCNISGLTAVPKQGKSWSSSFSVSEAITLFTQWPMVFLLTTTLP
jgi:hypothetical protein